jgi:hypothetical protein
MKSTPLQSIIKFLFIITFLTSCGKSNIDKVHDAYNAILKLEPRELCNNCSTYKELEGKTRNDFTTAGGAKSGFVNGQSFVRLEYDSVNKKANLYTNYGNYIITIDDMITGGNGKWVKDNWPIEFENNPFTFDERSDTAKNYYGIGFKGEVSSEGTHNYTINMNLNLKDSSFSVMVFNEEVGYNMWANYYFKDFQLLNRKFDDLVNAVKELKK